MHRGSARYAQNTTDDRALLERHAGLIEGSARRVAQRAGGVASPEDLWSAGALGLLDAARRFDPARGVRFETFAEHRIRGAMLDELRRMDHLPRRLRADTDRLKKARSRLAGELSREPSSEELAADLGVDLETLGTLDSLIQAPLPITSELPLVSPTGAADAHLERQQVVRALEAAINDLPSRLSTLLSLYYVEELTYREVANVLEVSEARVCQLHTEAIGLLRTALKSPTGV